MPDNTDDYWGSVHERVPNLAPQADLLAQGPFSLADGYAEWIKGGRNVPVEYEGQEVLVPAPFSTTGVTIDLFEKRVRRALRQI